MCRAESGFLESVMSSCDDSAMAPQPAEEGSLPNPCVSARWSLRSGRRCYGTDGLSDWGKGSVLSSLPTTSIGNQVLPLLSPQEASENQPLPAPTNLETI